MAMRQDMNRVILTVVVTGSCILALPEFAHAGLIIGNSSFESGNTGFTSDYTYLPPNSGNMGEARYGVISSLDQAHWAWDFYGDLSAESGSNYFVANGSTSSVSLHGCRLLH